MQSWKRYDILLPMYFMRQRSKFGVAMKETIGRMFHKEDAAAAAVTPFQAVCSAIRLSFVH